MGTWSPTILGNDTSCEVRDRFLEIYNSGYEPTKIANLILEEQSENIIYDRTNVWFGLAQVCWECKVLTKDIISEIEKIIESREDINFNKELDADEKFLKNRQKVLDKFLLKILIEKEKAKPIKKEPTKLASIYSAGMCLTYKNNEEKYIGIYLTKSEHYRNKGRIVFWFMDFETTEFPKVELFRRSKLYGLKKLGSEWNGFEYIGNTSDITYEKNSKEDFYRFVQSKLTIVAEIEQFNENKITNNFKGRGLNLSNFIETIERIESVRIEGKSEFELSKLTLEELLKKTEL